MAPFGGQQVFSPEILECFSGVLNGGTIVQDPSREMKINRILRHRRTAAAPGTTKSARPERILDRTPSRQCLGTPVTEAFPEQVMNLLRTQVELEGDPDFVRMPVGQAPDTRSVVIDLGRPVGLHSPARQSLPKSKCPGRVSSGCSWPVGDPGVRLHRRERQGMEPPKWVRNAEGPQPLLS